MTEDPIPVEPTPSPAVSAAPGDAPSPGSSSLDRRSIGAVVAVVLAARVLLYASSARPLFYSDSGEYLEIPHRFYLPPDRPIGLSMFYDVLLGLWHDLRVLVIGQALLGVASATLAMLAAARVGARRHAAVGVGLLVGLSPTNLVYERTMLAEALILVLTLTAIVLALSALDAGRYGRAIAAGVTIGLIAVVRTNNAVVGIGLVLIVLAAPAAIGWRTRFGLSGAIAVAALGPVLAYGALNYVDTFNKTGHGTFALSHFDGIALYAKVAPWTECDDPGRAPPIRAEVCRAGQDYRESGVDPIVWSPGPVNSALGSPDVAEKNAELRRLAYEAIVTHPWSVLREAAATAWTDLTAVDFRYVDRARDGGYAGVIVERYFGAAEADAGSPRFAGSLQDAYGAWARVRPIVWVGCLAAIVVGLRHPRRRSRAAVLGLGAFALPVAAVAVAGGPLPRYIAPYEAVAVIAAAWSVQWVLDLRSARRASADAPPDDPGPPPGVLDVAGEPALQRHQGPRAAAR